MTSILNQKNIKYHTYDGLVFVDLTEDIMKKLKNFFNKLKSETKWDLQNIKYYTDNGFKIAYIENPEVKLVMMIYPNDKNNHKKLDIRILDENNNPFELSKEEIENILYWLYGIEDYE